jgi:hypothetical protein
MKKISQEDKHMAAGDVVKTYRFRKETITLKTTTGCTKGQELCWDTDGYAPATQALLAGPLAAVRKKYIATDTVVAPGSGQSEASVLAEGVIGILKVAGALVKGQKVGVTSTAGSIGALAGPDAPSTYAEATMQAEFDKLQFEVGEVLEDAASGDAFANVIVG